MKSPTKYLFVVLRRCAHLAKRVDDGTSKDPGWDLTERAALEWLLEQYRQHIRPDLLAVAEEKLRRGPRETQQETPNAQR